MSPQFSKIAVVILQYNNSRDTVKCLDSLKLLNYDDFEVVVVDNASEINEQEKVRHYLENSYGRSFEFIVSGHNLGYAGGNNLGIRHALEHVADYVLILNPDTTVEKDLLTKLVTKAESDPKIGIVAPLINEANRKVCGGVVHWLKPELSHISENLPDKSNSGGGDVSFLQTTAKSPAQKKDTSRSPYVRGKTFFLTGACILVKREVFELVGFFDERYFLYFEDADFCLRAQELGYRLNIAKDAMIHHTVSASTSKLGSPLLLRYHYRNAHLFNFKNGPWWAILALPFWSILVMIRQLIKLVLIPKKRPASFAIMMGVVDFYRWKWGKI